MKNIYIIGVPRSGKTTLARFIKLKYPEFNVISFEAVRNGFIKSQPNLNMESRKSKARQKILPQFLIEFVYWNNIISSYGNIVEGSFGNIETIIKYIDKNDIIVCLGFNRRNLREIIDGIKKNDTQYDYTKKWTDEQISKHFYDITEKDKENYEFCRKHNLNYYDTYENRKEVFLHILEYIERQL